MRYNLLSYYRIVAAYLILLIHQQFWNMGPLAGGFKNAAVPLFAAMSGFLFSVLPDKGFAMGLKGKANRILVPYLVWAVVYFAANNVLLDGIVRHQRIAVPGVRSWLLGGTACHLWFLPALFLVFVLAMILRKIRSGKWIGIILVAMGVASQFLPGETSASFSGYCRIYLGRLMLYFGLGYVVGQVKLTDKAMIVIGAIMTAVGVGNLVFGFVQGLSWSPIMFVLGLLFIAKGAKNVADPAWVEDFASATMGIYLVHVLFTSLANFALGKAGCMPMSPFLSFPLTLVLFASSCLSVRWLPKWVRG